MEVPKDVVEKWQATWRKLLDMAYHRKNIASQFWTENTHYDELYLWSRYARNFDKIQFETTWEKYDVKDSNGYYIDPQCIQEVELIYVPRILFETLGIKTFLETCFPNAQVSYWEDDGPA